MAALRATLSGSGAMGSFYPRAVTEVAAVVGWQLAAKRVAASRVPIRRAV